MGSYIPQIVTGIGIGLTVIIIMRIYNILTRPKLDISFDSEDTFNEVPIGKIGDVAKSEFLSKIGLYVHLNINNKRKSLARNCKVFLVKLEKYNESKKAFENINLEKHFHLKWANEDQDKEGYEGLEIPGKYRRRVDLIHSEKGDTQVGFFIKIKWLGIGNRIGEGIYRMSIQASGENTNTTTKKFIVIWKGAFLKENVCVVKESFNYKTKRFVKNKLGL